VTLASGNPESSNALTLDVKPTIRRMTDIGSDG